MNCRIGNLDSVLLGEPLLNLGVAAEALRLGEPILQSIDYLRRNRLLAGLRTWGSHLLDLLDPPFFVEVEPVGNSVAMDIQLAGRCASALGLARFQKKEHLEARLDLGILFLANKPFKRLDRLGNVGKVVHGRKSSSSGTIQGKESPNLYIDPKHLVLPFRDRLTVRFEPLGKLLSAELPGRDLTDHRDRFCLLRLQPVAVPEQKRPGREQARPLVSVGKGMVFWRRPSQ